MRTSRNHRQILAPRPRMICCALCRWKTKMIDYYDKMNTLVEQVFVLLAVSIGVDPANFEGRFSESLNNLRLIHYLPEVIWLDHSELPIPSTQSRQDPEIYFPWGIGDFGLHRRSEIIANRLHCLVFDDSLKLGLLSLISELYRPACKRLNATTSPLVRSGETVRITPSQRQNVFSLRFDFN